MAGMLDLVLAAQPALAAVEGGATEGRDWRWEFQEITDADGNDVDLTTAVGACTIYDNEGNKVLDLTVTGNIGGFILSATSVQTTGIEGLSWKRPRSFRWECSLAMDGYTVSAWNASDSPFLIHNVGGGA